MGSRKRLEPSRTDRKLSSEIPIHVRHILVQSLELFDNWTRLSSSGVPDAGIQVGSTWTDRFNDVTNICLNRTDWRFGSQIQLQIGDLCFQNSSVGPLRAPMSCSRTSHTGLQVRSGIASCHGHGSSVGKASWVKVPQKSCTLNQYPVAA